MSSAKTKKIMGIIGNACLYAFLILVIVLVSLSIASRKDGGDAMTLFGRQMRIVVSASMEECDQTDVSDFDVKSIPVKSMVFIETVPEDEQEAKAWYDELEVGDVCTFQYRLGGKAQIITHRIIEKARYNEGWKIVLQGDNKADSENVKMGVQTIYTDTESVDYIIGKVTGQSRVLGFITYIMKQPIGIALIVLTVIGIKYMVSSAGDRADIKKNAIPYLIGAVVMLSAAGIIDIIQKFVNSTI
jgi:signal peptidase I